MMVTITNLSLIPEFRHEEFLLLVRKLPDIHMAGIRIITFSYAQIFEIFGALAKVMPGIALVSPETKETKIILNPELAGVMDLAHEIGHYVWAVLIDLVEKDLINQDFQTAIEEGFPVDMSPWASMSPEEFFAVAYSTWALVFVSKNGYWQKEKTQIIKSFSQTASILDNLFKQPCLVARILSKLMVTVSGVPASR